MMYLGRGDCRTFAVMRRLVSGWSVDQGAMAGQMYGKAPLVKYLTNGLAKLRSEIARPRGGAIGRTVIRGADAPHDPSFF